MNLASWQSMYITSKFELNCFKHLHGIKLYCISTKWQQRIERKIIKNCIWVSVSTSQFHAKKAWTWVNNEINTHLFPLCNVFPNEFGNVRYDCIKRLRLTDKANTIDFNYANTAKLSFSCWCVDGYQTDFVHYKCIASSIEIVISLSL